MNPKEQTSTEIRYCPVCGHGPWQAPFVNASELRSSYEICECCGCEYGYDDNVEHFEVWIATGMTWFHPQMKPGQWNLEDQLKHVIRPWPPEEK